MKPVRKVLWAASIVAALLLAVVVGFWLRPISYFNRMLYLQLALAGVHSRTVEVNGIRIHYYEQGRAESPAVVLVHGLGGRAEDWRNLTPFLLAEGFHVFVPDLPGFGRSERPANFSYSIPDQEAVVLGFMDAVGVKQADLGGWSMGGWIVQRLAADHPDRVRKLMLFDSAGIHEAPKWKVGLFTPESALELEALDALLMPHPPQVPEFIAKDILRTSRENAWVVRRALNSMLAGKDTTEELLPKLKMPVLIVWGSDDHITPVSQGEKIHQLVPQSQLVVINGCGHLAAVQCADRIAPKMETFLTR